MGPVWILFAANSARAEQQLKGIFVPINTEFLVAKNTENENILIEEVYNIEKDKPKVWHYFGEWETGSGFRITSSPLFERRSNFHGMTFHNPPLTTLKWEKGKLLAKGFVGSIWNDMQKGLNFTYNVFIRKPDQQEVEWRTFLTPFSSGIWYTTVVYLIVTAVGLDVTHHFSKIYSQTEINQKDMSAFSFKNSLFYVYGLLCQQGTDMVPHSYSSRMAFSTALFVAVVLLANYSATLISFLTVRIEKLPFEDLEGLYADGTYKYGTQGKSAQYFYYKVSY
ncbi:hypothetical protein C0J52_21512 [Blattella germanica]|nr:hypothetical protein C0J52_21512 [Blattella germanica]